MDLKNERDDKWEISDNKKGCLSGGKRSNIENLRGQIKEVGGVNWIHVMCGSQKLGLV